MPDDFGIESNLDRLPPAEKLGDSKEKGNRPDLLRKKKGQKKPPFPLTDNEKGKDEETGDHSKGEHAGKILDIVI